MHNWRHQMGQSVLIEVIIQRDWCSTMGLEAKVMAVRYSVSSANILCGIVVSFICFSFLSFILLHSPHLLLFHTRRTAPKSYRWLCLQSALSQMSLILWMLWCIPPLLPILQGNLPPTPPPPWPVSLWSQWVPGPWCIQLAWLRKLAQLVSLTTRITTLSPSSTAHQDWVPSQKPTEISPSSQSTLQ